MRRNAFTMIELISVIVVIGILSSMAIPKFSGVKDQASKSTELATAASVSAALEAIHGTWSISESDFDWNNDGVDDDIETDLAKSGYPYDLSRNGDPLGAVIKASGKSGFVEQKAQTTAGAPIYRIYTSKASHPQTGSAFTTQSASKDIEGKPDKNDFWLYMATTESHQKCYIESSLTPKRQIISGDFLLLDVNGTTPVDFARDDLGIAFSITCS